jgi:hypothetical protein
MIKQISTWTLVGFMAFAVGCGSDSDSESSTAPGDDSQSAFDVISGDTPSTSNPPVQAVSSLLEIGVVDWEGESLTGSQYGYVEGNWNGTDSYTETVIDGSGIVDVNMLPGKSYTLIVDKDGVVGTVKVVVLATNTLDIIEDVYLPIDCSGNACVIDDSLVSGVAYGLVSYNGTAINRQDYVPTFSFSETYQGEVFSGGVVEAGGAMYAYFDIPADANPSASTGTDTISLTVANADHTGTVSFPLRGEYVTGINIDLNDI